MTGPASEPVAQLRLVDRIRQAQTVNRRKIIVPEWDNAELWFTRMTFADMQSVDDRKPKDRYERNILILIAKAEDANGVKLFTYGEKHPLMAEFDMVVVQRVVNFMFEAAMPPGAGKPDEPGADQTAIDGKKKELQETPT